MSVQLKPVKDQVVVVTGASSGIGRATALRFARHGATVVLAARNQEALEAVADEIRQMDGNSLVVPTDVSDSAQVKRLADEAITAFGRIDTWVNNAGVSEYSYIADQPLDEIHQIVHTNLMGVIYGCKAALDAGMRIHGGAIINIGSVLSERSIPLQGVYCATKHAVKGFTDSLRMELAREQAPVSVTLIKPAVINTPFYRNARSRMGKRPTPTPPIYPPEVVAEAIVTSAYRPMRDVYAGGAGLGFGIGEAFAPAAMDKFMVGTDLYFEGQLSDEEDSGQSHLFSPMPGKGSVTGGYENTVSSSPVTRYLELQPTLKKAVIASLFIGAVALIVRRSAA